MPEVFRKLGENDKKMERYATTAQDILWKYYDYERLSKEVGIIFNDSYLMTHFNDSFLE